MADRAQLNGAYYGPSIPPPSRPSKSYNRPGRGGDCCCCGCIFRLIFKIILTIVVIIGLAILIIWLIFRPNRIKFHVTDAELTEFSFKNGSDLHYNLALNITIRNPNKRIGVYYDRIEARAYYEGERFDAEMLPKFYQGHKNTTVLSPVFKGQNIVDLSGDEQSKFNEQKTAEVYDIDVKLYLRIRFKYHRVKTWRMKPKVKCELKVPLTANGTISTVVFQRTKCDLDF